MFKALKKFTLLFAIIILILIIFPNRFSAKGLNEKNLTTPSVLYVTHVEDIGWLQNISKNGEISGTVGKAKHIEAIKIKLEDTPFPGGIQYQAHVQDFGWETPVSDGEQSGTTGKNKHIEAIKINLTGIMAEHYDVYYRVHVEKYGWLGWAKNGEPAGSEGLAKQVEAIEIILSEKTSTPIEQTRAAFVKKPNLSYKTHVEQYGWLNFVSEGQLSGTVGQKKQVEAIAINLNEITSLSGKISYSTHVENIGWLNYVSNGAFSGTTGENKQLEAIKIKLEGQIAEFFDVYYRVHVEDFGWMGWTKNNSPAGTEGFAKQIEAIEIILVEKGKNVYSETEPYLKKPSVNYKSHVQDIGWMDFVSNGKTSGTVGKAKQMEAISINLERNTGLSGEIFYSTHIQDIGWLDFTSSGTISGTTGQNKQMEAIRISLTGQVAEFFDIYYRVHVEDLGWMGWAKNGMRAGTQGFNKQIEAIELKLVLRGKGNPVNENLAFKKDQITIFLDPGHGGKDVGATAGGYNEADINLKVTKKVKSILISRGYKVILSREDDVFIDLYDRPRMANKVGADIFVSIHTNSTTSKTTSANGIETFYYKYNPTYPSKINLAMHNNNERVSKGETLSKFLQENMVGITGANNRGINDASFVVIRETVMPAALIELGFINNPNERNMLVLDSYQSKIAKAIADGIEQYFKNF